VCLVSSVPNVCEHSSVSATVQKERANDTGCELSHSIVVSRIRNIISISYISSTAPAAAILAAQTGNKQEFYLLHAPQQIWLCPWVLRIYEDIE
jgi:hypothetical protein